ncbi:hypothetical protein MFIFM68171_08172 [Madurella fahalii]|uniref:Uncharacterized protein n=1 Tax=Madurella fahalii TaxID=1157608 RepID=A0ABQ0GJM1_9PEZI
MEPDRNRAANCLSHAFLSVSLPGNGQAMPNVARKPQQPEGTRLLLPAASGPPPSTPASSGPRYTSSISTKFDLQRVLRSAGETILKDRGRAEQVVATPLFRTWLASPDSARLLVHGNFDSTDAGSRPVSPFPVLCAEVVKALRLSSSPSGPAWTATTAEAMVRSLIAQLLRQFPAGIIEPDPGVTMADVEREDITLLCRLFAYLVQQLPASTTVFCLIGGINVYESEEYLHGIDAVVLALLESVDEDGGQHSERAKFKLLLMSPQPTVEVRKVFDNVSGTLLHMA